MISMVEILTDLTGMTTLMWLYNRSHCLLSNHGIVQQVSADPKASSLMSLAIGIQKEMGLAGMTALQSFPKPLANVGSNERNLEVGK